MFIECARWADDVKFTPNDRPTYHTARWPIVADDAPQTAKDAAAARDGKPTGQALEALTLNFAVLSNPESSHAERAMSLCWVFHIVGDIHQPMHTGDLFSAVCPEGNPAATLSYVQDPAGTTTMPLHILWDSNSLRVPTVEVVTTAAEDFTTKYPRSSFPELQSHPVGDPKTFKEWAQESHQVAVDWAFDLKTAPDPNKDQDSDTLVRNMVNFILNGVSPVAEAPDVPPEYWEKLQLTAQQRITLAGYRIADLLNAAADDIEAQRKFVGP